MRLSLEIRQAPSRERTTRRRLQCRRRMILHRGFRQLLHRGLRQRLGPLPLGPRLMLWLGQAKCSSRHLLATRMAILGESQLPLGRLRKSLLQSLRQLPLVRPLQSQLQLL